MYADMRQKPSLATQQLRMLARRSPQLALEMLREMASCLAEVNVRHYNAAFSTSSWSEICSIMRKMRQLELLPDADMPFDNHICHNACLDACEKGEQWGISLRLLISMPLRQLLLDAIGWTSVISACQHHLAWKSAVHSLGLMRATGASPNVQSCGAAIASCRERWADAVELCRGLAASRALNAVASNAVLSSLAISAVSSGDWRRAFGALGAFASRGLVRAKANGLNACLASLAVGSWPVALQTLRVLRARAGVDTFGPVVSSLEKSIKWREAFHAALGLLDHDRACRVQSPVFTDTRFEDLGLDERLLKGLEASLGRGARLTPVQQRTLSRLSEADANRLTVLTRLTRETAHSGVRADVCAGTAS
ncbi:unnamed protein product [Effrenium voratum]|nr:unnamed protein product [Effrenium voratum]